MKRLIILRHAKSDWERGVDDHERPLNGRGRRTAPAVGRHLAAIGWTPGAVRSSDSARTRETWSLIAPHFPDADVTFTRDLYLAEVAEIGAVIAGLDPMVDTALILGHNPGLSTAVLQLSGISCEMRTADAALLETDLSWADSVGSFRKWRLERVVIARDLTD